MLAFEVAAGVLDDEAGVVEHDDADVVLLRRLAHVVLQLRLRLAAEEVSQELAVDLRRRRCRVVESPLLLLAVRQGDEDAAGQDERPDHEKHAGGDELAVQRPKAEH